MVALGALDELAKGDKTREQIQAAAQARGVPFGPIFSPAELIASEQYVARGFLAAMDHPTLGALRLPQLWWCVAAIPLIGLLNLCVSFYFAFQLALRARNVSGVDRARIRAAIFARWRERPGSFFLP